MYQNKMFWKRARLLGGREVNGRLGGRGLGGWAGKILTTVALLGRRVEGRTAGRRERVRLLGGKEVDDLVGEGCAAVQERD